jgi:hypothetical protein
MTRRASSMSRLCKWVTVGFALLSGAALALFAIGTLGLYGAERDPLSAVFLLPLGLPWNRLIDGAPDVLRPWLAAAAPLLNLLMIWAGCRALHLRKSS